ncbi:TetR family transcriptional regulator [Methylobacterium sp. Leaf111]|uniref:TetR/AcrR family transcriptional regulator n=1 Tax=unclassified Methylobacterium TaxID=2615210 RepID=UPI0006F4F623|nr:MULTISPECIES: TetR/AcrR family transcriptional regulator [unclassified Methylobacterium]KQO56559.1 TetR family transcriptional regulator [Methylobacterium sp. Leaf86]KQP69947.1 TetR family transcriptional regulator [Methylobacterium sp. Leaf111]
MTIKGESPTSRGRGRPRLFDRTAALDRAMRVFWDRGYEGATFDELIAVMGVSPSSFYNAFGNKEALYREAVGAYLTGPGGFFPKALTGGGSARDAFARLMMATAAAYTDDTGPAGCMISLAGLHDAPERADLRDFMRDVRGRSLALMVDRLDEGVRNGDLPEGTDLAQIAEFFETVFRGMAVRARDGADRGMLEKTGVMALDAWPGRRP